MYAGRRSGSFEFRASHTLSTILHSCVARSSCCRFPIKGSMTKCWRISDSMLETRGFNSGKAVPSNVHSHEPKGKNSPLLPVCMQSTPSLEFFSLTCLDFIDANVSMGLKPEFSARAMGIASSASAKARIAYCSSPGLYRWLKSAWVIIVEL